MKKITKKEKIHKWDMEKQLKLYKVEDGEMGELYHFIHPQFRHKYLMSQ